MGLVSGYLLQKDFVKLGILNSYAGIIVDEYQDCTVPMHQLIVGLKALLPCRILGDELQGIFDFGRDPLVSWSDVTREFVNDLGELKTPHRWLKAENEALGRWLLGARSDIQRDQEPDYRGSPIDRLSVKYDKLSQMLTRLTNEKEGRICVIRSKTRPLPAGTETTLVKRNYRVLEPNELSELRSLILALTEGSTSAMASAAFRFLKRAHGGLSADDKKFIEKILRNEDQRLRRLDRRKLRENHSSGTTPILVLDLLNYVEQIAGTSCKLSESVSALKCIIEEHRATSRDLKTLYADEISKRKYQNRNKVYRCIGSTLLVKGLEFDHVVVLRGPNWQQSWGNYRDLYVALTRGTKTVTLIELTN